MQRIEAIYENGVFKPLQKIDFKDHEKVEIRVLSKDEWQRRFNALIQKIQRKAAQYTSEEIEADIATAVKEVKAGKRGH